MSKTPTVLEEDLAKTSNQFKTFEGQRYTGMRVGGHHRWHYDPGDWKETKVSPDRWEFTFAVHKRRAGHAPPGSGVPVGTEYHWYILGHQVVRKLDENTYTTALTGAKYKLAHKRAEKQTWSASEAAQRRRLIQILEEAILTLKKAPDPSNARAGEDGKATPPRRRPRKRATATVAARRP